MEIHAYLSGDREPGVRVPVEPDRFDRMESYVRRRLLDDHGVWVVGRGVGRDERVAGSPGPLRTRFIEDW